MSQQYNRFHKVSSRAIKIAVGLLVLMVTIGITGYHLIEDLNFIDSLYMTIITISTVGFKEVGAPLTDAGKLFTIGLIVFSIGSLAFVGSSMARFVLDGELANYIKTYKVDKKIAKLKNHVIIVEYGRNGEQAAMELAEHGVDLADYVEMP